MKILLQKILADLARATIKKYNPIIIGVTGSVGKTSVKDAVFCVLNKKLDIRRSEKSLNTEIGLPLTILGAKNHYRNVFGWTGEILKAKWRLWFKSNYPKVLVLEYGIQKPKDMDYLLSIARPNIALVTALGEIPVHVEFFKDPDDVRLEKSKLVQALPANGYAILNHDDYAVYDMKEKTSAHVLTFGFEEHADFKITNYKLRIRKDERLGDVPEGVSFKIKREGSEIPIRLKNTFGIPQVYAVTAAIAVGSVMDLNMVEISEAMESYKAPPGRMKLIRGIKNSFILDDSYNASPESMRAALNTLRELPGRRKIAVLGDMLEIGKFSEQAHRSVGDIAAEFLDLLITVGPRAKFIADEAMSRGIERNGRRLNLSQVIKFEDSIPAGRALDSIIKEGDLILVKGSQALRMEKAVFEIMRHPEMAEEILVRQDKHWKNK